MREKFLKIAEKTEEFRDDMLQKLMELTSIPALSPENGGDGEWEKAEFVKKILKNSGADEIVEINAPDYDTDVGLRPNFYALFKGKSSKKSIWVITHLDVEPPGNLALWLGDPFDPYIDQGKVYGRGSEDNNQDIVASIYAIKILQSLGIKPQYDVKLLFVSDEESGSEKGMKYILKKKPEIFSKNDYYIVADGGTPEGNIIEISEKAVLWIKFRIRGVGTHAATPHLGKNTLRICAKLIQKLESLYKTFDLKNDIFDPPYSTFEPTLKEKNVPNINMIPGEDTFYMDCRLLPEYSLDELIKRVKRIVSSVERRGKVVIDLDFPLRIDSAPQTDENSQIVKILKKAIKTAISKKPMVEGIGEVTLASFLREKGYEVAVWRKVEHTGHKPNEYALIDNMLTDAQVFSLIFSGAVDG